MKAQFAKSTAVLALSVFSMAIANAQASDWDFQCIDPGTMVPFSTPFIWEGVANDLFGVKVWN